MGEMYTKFWSENLKGRDHLEDQGIDGNIILEVMHLDQERASERLL
jgi:hypothetical protein